MYYIGLLSGTSMDAIDIALVDIKKHRIETIHYAQYPFPKHLRHAVRALTLHSYIIQQVRLDIALGHVFADAVRTFIADHDITATDISAIGSHGQTVLHLCDKSGSYSLQIGDANIIAYKTGITTVADFRRMDIAAAGQGAPLSAAFHQARFKTVQTSRVILNIGGIANITFLPANDKQSFCAFDSGPGNGLLDDWNQLHRHTDMDQDSAWANSGTVDPELLGFLLDDPYFSLAPPKSTGRDHFNLAWLDQRLQRLGKNIAENDVQASLLELTVASITDAVNRYAAAATEIYVCGGGVHNPTMLARLRARLPTLAIAATDRLGVDPDAVEAITFAWLAYCRIHHIPIKLTKITGAEKNLLLGAIYAGNSEGVISGK